MKSDRPGPAIWTWLDQPHETRGEAGGHKRPWSIRERLVSEAVGAEVRRLRIARGITVYQLAQRLCISQPHVSYLETGRRAVWIPLLWDLADIFHVSAAHFIEVADEEIKRRRMVV